jgi:hypothetical protein
MSDELVDPHFTVGGLPCKSKGDMITCGIGLPARNPKVQFVVKMRVNEHREQAVRRKKEELARALVFMAAATGSFTCHTRQCLFLSLPSGAGTSRLCRVWY